MQHELCRTCGPPKYDHCHSICQPHCSHDCMPPNHIPAMTTYFSKAAITFYTPRPAPLPTGQLLFRNSNRKSLRVRSTREQSSELFSDAPLSKRRPAFSQGPHDAIWCNSARDRHASGRNQAEILHTAVPLDYWIIRLAAFPSRQQ